MDKHHPTIIRRIEHARPTLNLRNGLQPPGYLPHQIHISHGLCPHSPGSRAYILQTGIGPQRIRAQ
jgi:hypothetical protein